MASIAQSPFFEVPVRWFELPIGSHRNRFVAPDLEAVAVPPAPTENGEQNPVSSGDGPRTHSATGRDGPGKLLDERA